MRAIMVVMIFSAVIGWLVSIYELDPETNSTSNAEDSQKGSPASFIRFRRGVLQYAWYQRNAPDGVIEEQSLAPYLPVEWDDDTWHARIQGGYIYVWGETSWENIYKIRRILGEPGVGGALNGYLDPGGTALPAFIPSGNVVSVFGSGRYKPNNEHY